MTSQTLPSRRSSYLAALAGLVVTVAFVMYPEAAFEASLDGLKLWFEIVLPALLPFFTMSEILMGLGVIHAVGVLLEPLMRPVFRIPGVGGFAVAMGLASGYPLGAKISGRIRRDGLCTREEGERLVSFANTADPLFMVGAVAVGMFGMAHVGLIIAIAHYISVVIVGFAMRYHAGGASGDTLEETVRGHILANALDALVKARRKDGRPFGELFSDAVRESLSSMLFVGGCIMMFSVLIRIVADAGVVALAAAGVERLLPLIGLDPDLALSLIKGTFEITIGAQEASVAQATLAQRVIAASAIIGWSGFSVHAQVAAMVHGTDIRIRPYLMARLGHAILAAAITWLLWEPLGGAQAAIATAPETALAPGFPLPLAVYWGGIAAAAFGITAILVALSLLIHTCRRVRWVVFRVR